MKHIFRLALFFPVAILVGCAVPNSPSSTALPLNGNWTNWQVQTGTSSITPPTALTSPPTGIYLVGAMQAQGSQVTGIFQTNADSGSGLATVNFTGSFDSTTSVLSLTSTPPYLAVQLTLSSDLTMLGTGNFSVGCPPPPPGGATCTAIALLPAAGAEIAPINGTYSGTLTDSASSSLSGTASLTLTQSSTPNSSGQFPLSGTLTFPSSSGFGTAMLGGAVAGLAITLSDVSAAPNSPTVNLTASTNTTASQIIVSNLSYTGTGSGTFTGTLTLQ